MRLIPRPAPGLLLALCLAGGLLGAGCKVESHDAGFGFEPTAAPADTVVEEHEPVALASPALVLRLPTDNDALLRGDEGDFYQDLDRAIRGIRPRAWEGGRYGFVRTPVRTPGGYVFNQLHEGVDIRPLRRDGQGEPLDSVRAVADGTVAYVNDGAGRSSYGRYVVVRHAWDGVPVYSLYAHLATADVDTAEVVAAGAPLGRMGYTGRGLGRHRAHVHLEVALLLNRHYQPWHDAFYGSKNHHGLYFGKNLAGINPAALVLALAEEPGLTFEAFVRRQPVAYRLALPGDRPLDFFARYPWLAEPGVSPADTARDGAWVVSFTREGVPVQVGRQPEPVAQPEVVYVAPEVRQRYLSTGGVLARSGGRHVLTRAGRAYAALLATSAAGVPPWF